MARSFGQIQVDIWKNEDFLSLDQESQRLYLYLATQSKLSFAGVLSWRPRFVATSAKGLTVKAVESTAGRLVESGFIVIDDHTEELLVRSFVRNDGLLKSPNLAKAMLSDWRAIDSVDLKKVVAYEVQRLSTETPELKGLQHVEEVLEHPSRNPFDTLQDTLQDRDAEQTQTHTHSQTSDTANAAKEKMDNEFKSFYANYPRKIARADAEKAFKKARRKADLETIITGLEKFKEVVRGKEKDFIAHPATWLNAERWNDDHGPTQTDGAPVPNQYRMFN